MTPHILEVYIVKSVVGVRKRGHAMQMGTQTLMGWQALLIYLLNHAANYMGRIGPVILDFDSSTVWVYSPNQSNKIKVC